jgi:hypothetical protein
MNCGPLPRKRGPELFVEAEESLKLAAIGDYGPVSAQDEPTCVQRTRALLIFGRV